MRKKSHLLLLHNLLTDTRIMSLIVSQISAHNFYTSLSSSMHPSCNMREELSSIDQGYRACLREDGMTSSVVWNNQPRHLILCGHFVMMGLLKHTLYMAPGVTRPEYHFLNGSERTRHGLAYGPWYGCWGTPPPLENRAGVGSTVLSRCHDSLYYASIWVFCKLHSSIIVIWGKLGPTSNWLSILQYHITLMRESVTRQRARICTILHVAWAHFWDTSLGYGKCVTGRLFASYYGLGYVDSSYGVRTSIQLTWSNPKEEGFSAQCYISYYLGWYDLRALSINCAIMMVYIYGNSSYYRLVCLRNV